MWTVAYAIIACFLSCLLTTAAWSQSYERYSQSAARLIAEHQRFDPQAGVRVALDIVSDRDWHTYWKNPGDSGAAPILELSSSQSLVFGEVNYPIPKRIDVGPLTTFGYEGRVLLIVNVKPPAGWEPTERVTINLSAEWLVCKVECIPAFADFSITLPVGEATAFPQHDHAAAFAESEGQWPEDLPPQVSLKALADPSRLQVTSRSYDVLDFFPASDAGLKLARPVVDEFEDKVTLFLPPSDTHAATPSGIKGLLLLGNGINTVGVEIDAPYQAESSLGLLTMILFGFLGGVILNLMPCVLPVVGIKMLSLTKQAHASRPRTRVLVVSYVAGVLSSFLGLAGLLLVLQWTGSSLGWGFQLQSPRFVLGLVILFFLIAANLLGWLPVHWVPQWQPGRVSQPDGVAYEFLTGVLAVLVATPCTAPFMGAAIGAALAMGPLACLAVFASLGFGLAFPYVLILINPKVTSWLPRPGAWMEIMRQLLAFPMFATAIWLLWVMSQQVGDLAWLVGLGVMLILGFAIWIKRWWPRTAGVMGVGVAIVGLILVPYPNAPIAGSTTENSGQIEWIPFDPATIEKRRASQPVFIDFTAAWCITCQVNKKVTFYDEQVMAFLRQHNVAMVQADWTNRNPTITQHLRKYGRAGVPMYLLYGPGSGPPVLLPELLTPSIFVQKISDHLGLNH